jgi:hypothetical protein
VLLAELLQDLNGRFHVVVTVLPHPSGASFEMAPMSTRIYLITSLRFKCPFAAIAFVSLECVRRHCTLEDRSGTKSQQTTE